MIAPLFMLPAATGGRERIQSQHAEYERSEEVTAYKPVINPWESTLRAWTTKKEGSWRLRVVAKLARDRSSIAAVAKRFHEAVARKKVQSPPDNKRVDLIVIEPS